MKHIVESSDGNGITDLGKWQVITDAQRSGERLIVAKFGWAIRDAKGDWDDKVWCLFFALAAHFNTDKGYWTDGLERLVEPTHFMPLPEDAPPIPLDNGDQHE